MKLLNPGEFVSPTYPVSGKRLPDCVRTFLLGRAGEKRRVAFDPNSLEAWSLEPGEEPPEACGFEPNYPPAPNPAGARHLVLYLTHGCNLRCRYCFDRHFSGQGGAAPARGHRARPAVLSEPALERAVQLFAPRLSEWGVSFFGGEPTTAWPEFVLAVVKLKELAAQKSSRSHPLRVRFHLTTNGTLLTDERRALDRLDFLDREGFSLIVSLDGPRELPDRTRPAANGAEG